MQATYGIMLKVCYEPKMIINRLLYNTGWLGKNKENNVPWATHIIS